jgi:ankyrin repeat protein
MIDVLKIIILIYISYGLPINFNYASETLLNIAMKLNSPEIYNPLIKMGAKINLRKNTIQIGLNNSIKSKNFEYLIYSGMDTNNITSELSEEYKLIVTKSKILFLVNLLYHKYIFLDYMTMYDLIQTLLLEFE